MDVYGIAHGVMLDDDNDKQHHGAVNDLIEVCKNSHTLHTPVKFQDCLEKFLGLPPVLRDDKKPMEMLKAMTGGKIPAEKLSALRVEFCKALALN
jgi:hypothetical protein